MKISDGHRKNRENASSESEKSRNMLMTQEKSLNFLYRVRKIVKILLKIQNSRNFLMDITKFSLQTREIRENRRTAWKKSQNVP